MKRKIITILLSLAMVLALIPAYSGTACADIYQVSELNISIDYSKLNVKGTYAELAQSVADNLSFDFGEGNDDIVSDCKVGVSIKYQQGQAASGLYNMYPSDFHKYSGDKYTVMNSHLDKDDSLKISIYSYIGPSISNTESFITTFNGKTVYFEICSGEEGWENALASEATIAIESPCDNLINCVHLQIGSIEEIIEKASSQTSTSLYFPDPYVESIDGTLHRLSEVNFYNAELHQKEIAQIQNEVKDWKVTVRTKLTSKKKIRLYAYLYGQATEELYSYLDKGYTIIYDWYRYDSKNKKYKYIDSTDYYTYLDTDVKTGKTYRYKAKINILDEDGVIVKTLLSDCKYGIRKVK